MKRLMISGYCAIAVWTALIGAGLLPGQSTFGSFVGTVRDPSGAVVPGCAITLTNTGTSVQRSVVTDKQGDYVLVNLEPGTYQIVMKAPGFQELGPEESRTDRP